MRKLQPVLWTKGTLLSPQHLQIQDRYLEDSLQFQLDALSFSPWGFTRLTVDQEELEAGIFKVANASGIFPDGLLFDVPDADNAPNPRSISELFEQDQETLDVFLAVPQYRERGLNVSLGLNGADTRYIAEVALLRDEVTGLSEKPIQVAKKNFRLLVTGESQKGNSTLRIGRVHRKEAGTFHLDPRFVPPLLDIAASEYLVTLARRLVEILSAKSSELAGSRRQKNQSLAEFTASDIANFWLLYTVNVHLPLFRHIFEVKRGHPEEFFDLMTTLAGALTTFSLKVQPRDLPVYDHDDLAGCFTALDTLLRDLLETVIPTNFLALPLKEVQQSIYAASLAEDRFFDRTRMYLAVRADVDQATLINRVPQLVKVCSASHIEHLIRQALPGVDLRHEVRPPAALPMKLNHVYFSLNQSGLAWEAILRARNLAAYVPGDFPRAELELLILLPQAVKR
jgi:type VI secretion system protein ImpJ